jgi:hypothetical protein
MGVDKGGFGEIEFIGEGTWVMTTSGPDHDDPPIVGQVVRVGEGGDYDVTIWTGAIPFDGTERSLREGTVKLNLHRNTIKALDPLEGLATASYDIGPFHEIPEGWRICLNNDCMRWTAPGTAVYCSNECAYRDA